MTSVARAQLSEAFFDFCRPRGHRTTQPIRLISTFGRAFSVTHASVPITRGLKLIEKLWHLELGKQIRKIDRPVMPATKG
jgi:hypothetical protein